MLLRSSHGHRPPYHTKTWIGIQKRASHLRQKAHQGTVFNAGLRNSSVDSAPRLRRSSCSSSRAFPLASRSPCKARARHWAPRAASSSSPSCEISIGACMQISITTALPGQALGGLDRAEAMQRGLEGLVLPELEHMIVDDALLMKRFNGIVLRLIDVEQPYRRPNWRRERDKSRAGTRRSVHRKSARVQRRSSR